MIRDGRQRRIAGREVVRGDIIVLAEGDRVPADAALRYVMNLAADESLLTGYQGLRSILFDNTAYLRR